ncbi:MAG TPA: hypothetical protein VFQ91_17490 [Bryobacteraceae bacterium]|nr:hypothetical protein [Bryobacteraceae bacterium]
MEPPPPTRATRWLLPGLPLALALFTLFYAVVFYRAPEQLFRDSDTGWHIRTGERILRDHEVPHTDPYSFSKPGYPWFAWEWGADAAMGAAHRAAGLTGVTLLFLASLSLCTWLWAKLHEAAGANFWVLCLFASPMLTAVQLHWLARPHVFGWVWLLTALLLGERRRLSWPLALCLSILWTNTHGSFFLLPLLCLLQGAGWPVALAALSGSLVNPYGWNLHVHLARYLTDTELLSRIAEFQSFNFHTAGAAQIAAVLLLTMLGLSAALACGQWRRAAVLLLFWAMALRSARGIPVLALAGLPLAAGALTAALPAWQYWPTAGRRLFAYGDRLQALQRPLRGALLAIFLSGVFALAVAGSKPGFPAGEFPVAAVAYLPPGGRLFAPDKYGGFLIYRFDGARPVYFDGRSDYYGAAFLKDYIDMVELRPGWEALWRRNDFTLALLPVRYSLVDALRERGWKTRFADGTSVLLERNF